MSARQEMDKLLGQWRQLTRAEAGAIQSCAWPDVGAIQSAKQTLQKSLNSALTNWTIENGGRTLPADDPLRLEVGRLISLESRNAELVAVQMRRAEQEMRRQSESLRNLRLLRSSYGQPRGKGWESFS